MRHSLLAAPSTTTQPVCKAVLPSRGAWISGSKTFGTRSRPAALAEKMVASSRACPNRRTMTGTSLFGFCTTRAMRYRRPGSGMQHHSNRNSILLRAYLLLTCVKVGDCDDDNQQFVGKSRFVTMGMDALGRILVVIHTPRGDRIRIISARKASPSEAKHYHA